MKSYVGILVTGLDLRSACGMGRSSVTYIQDHSERAFSWPVVALSVSTLIRPPQITAYAQGCRAIRVEFLGADRLKQQVWLYIAAENLGAPAMLLALIG